MDCIECDKPIPAKSRYTFFCSMRCAADWGDDEALFQSYRPPAENHEDEKTFKQIREIYDATHPRAKKPH